MPHQEIYLAALDQQSCEAMSRLAADIGDGALADRARGAAERIQRRLLSDYYDAGQQFYGFSRNRDGSLDRTATIYPAVAWWSGNLSLPRADRMLTRWASEEFSTDWGTRDVSRREAVYDPISYHQGTVWPLFTGWVALAEYRAGRSLSGYAHLMQNADLTFAQDLGALTELLSGAYFQPLGRSTPHQMWSSAMVLAPAIRGLFGLEADAQRHTLRIDPHLPAGWDQAIVHSVPLGENRLDVTYRRSGARLEVEVRSTKPAIFCVATKETPKDNECKEPATTVRRLDLSLPPVELDLPHGLPLPGARTTQVKALRDEAGERGRTVRLAGQAGSNCEFTVRLNRPAVRVEGGSLRGNRLLVEFASTGADDAGYVTQELRFTW